MPNYEKMYYELFNALTDAIRQIELSNCEAARAIMIEAQQITEALYLSGETYAPN